MGQARGLFRGPCGCGRSPKPRGAGPGLEEEGPDALHRLAHFLVLATTRVEDYSSIGRLREPRRRKGVSGSVSVLNPSLSDSKLYALSALSQLS